MTSLKALWWVVGVLAAVTLVSLIIGFTEMEATSPSEPFETSTTVEVTTTTTRLATTTTIPLALGDYVFVEFMRDRSLEFDEVTFVDVASDATLIEFGLIICEGFNDGLDPLEIGEVIELSFAENFGESYYESDFQLIYMGIGAAVGSFCPEFSELVE